MMWLHQGPFSLAHSKLRLCSANHRAGYFSNLACDWLSIAPAYSEQETEKLGPEMATSEADSDDAFQCKRIL